LAEEREKIIESELKGVTLRVYWHILGSKKQVVGVRPVQRALGLSSPSVALHHLEKLRGLGLLEKDSTGEYHLIEQVKVGVLQNFVGRISSDRAGEGRGLAELCRSLGIHASPILVLLDHVHCNAGTLPDHLPARPLHPQHHGVRIWPISRCGLVE